LGSYLVRNGIPGNLIGTTALGKVLSRGTLAALGANGYLTSTFGSPPGSFFSGEYFLNHFGVMAEPQRQSRRHIEPGAEWWRHDGEGRRTRTVSKWSSPRVWKERRPLSPG
jgi:hypothetical protein